MPMVPASQTALRALRARHEADARAGGPVEWIVEGRPIGRLKAGMPLGEVERAGSPAALPHVLAGIEDDPPEVALAACDRPATYGLACVRELDLRTQSTTLVLLPTPQV